MATRGPLIMSHVYCCQIDCAWEDKRATHERVRHLVAARPPVTGSLFVLPEMFATGFSLDVARVAEGSDGADHAFLADLARAHHMFVLGGVVRAGRDGRGRNEAVVYDPAGSLVVRYCKLHPFSFADEHRHYEPGDQLACFEWARLRVVPMVCYDLRFPEAFRAALARGVDLFCVIANWPQARESHWLALLQARAIENQAFVVGVNRCGADPQHRYGGRSRIIDPSGRVLADAGNGSCLIDAAVDPDAVARQRRAFPVLADMRPDLAPGPPGSAPRRSAAKILPPNSPAPPGVDTMSQA